MWDKYKLEYFPLRPRLLPWSFLHVPYQQKQRNRKPERDDRTQYDLLKTVDPGVLSSKAIDDYIGEEWYDSDPDGYHKDKVAYLIFSIHPLRSQINEQIQTSREQ